MTTPSAVDEWKCGFCESSLGYEVVEQCKNCGEQWSHQCETVSQPVSDAEVSALEGRLNALDGTTVYSPAQDRAQTEGYIELARDAIALLRRRMAGAWQPIESAPKETEVLIGAYVNGEWRCGQSGFYFDRGLNTTDAYEPSYWYWSEDFVSIEEPTHWMPLPAPARSRRQAMKRVKPKRGKGTAKERVLARWPDALAWQDNLEEWAIQRLLKDDSIVSLSEWHPTARQAWADAARRIRK